MLRLLFAYLREREREKEREKERERERESKYHRMLSHLSSVLIDKWGL